MVMINDGGDGGVMMVAVMVGVNYVEVMVG